MTGKLFRIDLLNKRTGYDPELLNDMFQMFKESYPDYFTLISDRIESGDWKGVSEIAHRAKSAAAIMGMESIREEFNRMEEDAFNGDEIKDCQNWLSELNIKVTLAVSQIEEYISSVS